MESFVQSAPGGQRVEVSACRGLHILLSGMCRNNGKYSFDCLIVYIFQLGNVMQASILSICASETYSVFLISKYQV